MTTYAVHRKLPGITMEQLGGAQTAAIESSNNATADGTPVKYIRSNFYPGDSTCTCLFEAPPNCSIVIPGSFLCTAYVVMG